MTIPRQPRPRNPTSLGADDIAARSRLLDLRSEELDRFARTAAHDLRAPLRSIEAFTSLAIETDDEAEASEYLDRVLNAVQRMRRLLDSLLDFADAGDGAMEFSTAPLGEVVEAALADLSLDLEESRAVVDIGPLPAVECDATQLRRLFANVFSNSIKHTSSRTPRIVVRARDEPDRVLVTVADDGDGFDPELAEEAFQPFRRFSTAGTGQGIGLAICRRIAERHGGEIWADSEPGTGTTISITFPKTSTGA